MRILKSLTIVGAFISLSGCFIIDPCYNADCVYNEYHANFNIVNSAGQNVIFGPYRIYDKRNVKFFALKNKDTVVLDYTLTQASATGQDSILSVWFGQERDTAYIHLSNTDIDTLKITYRHYHNKCCGNITEITNFRYNDKQDIEFENYNILKK